MEQDVSDVAMWRDLLGGYLIQGLPAEVAFLQTPYTQFKGLPRTPHTFIFWVINIIKGHLAG